MPVGRLQEQPFSTAQTTGRIQHQGMVSRRTRDRTARAHGDHTWRRNDSPGGVSHMPVSQPQGHKGWRKSSSRFRDGRLFVG